MSGEKEFKLISNMIIDNDPEKNKQIYQEETMKKHQKEFNTIWPLVKEFGLYGLYKDEHAKLIEFFTSNDQEKYIPVVVAQSDASKIILAGEIKGLGNSISLLFELIHENKPLQMRSMLNTIRDLQDLRYTKMQLMMELEGNKDGK